jgi:hypothetical protein
MSSSDAPPLPTALGLMRLLRCAATGGPGNPLALGAHLD